MHAGVSVAGRDAVPDRRRRPRPADAQGRPPSSPTARSRGAPVRRRCADHTIPTITAAAEAAGRPAPRVIAALPVCVTDDASAARERAAKVFAVYGQLPSYRAMLDREGAAGAGRLAIVGDGRRGRRPRSRALADIGVTDFAAVEFGGDPDEVEATRAALVATLPGPTRRRVAGGVASACAISVGLLGRHRRRPHRRGVPTATARSRPAPSTRADRPRPAVPTRADWSHVSRPRPGPDVGVGVRARSHVPLDHADPGGRAGLGRASPARARADDDRRPLVLDPGGPGALRLELALVPRRRSAAGEPLDHFYPVGWDPRGVGRSIPPIDAARSTCSTCRTPTTASPAPGAARPTSARPTPPSTSSRSAWRSASNASTTSATATAPPSARSTRWPTPTASGGSCSTAPSTRRPAIPHGPLRRRRAGLRRRRARRRSSPASTSCATRPPRCAAGPHSAALVDDLERRSATCRRPTSPASPPSWSASTSTTLIDVITYDPYTCGLARRCPA